MEFIVTSYKDRRKSPCETKTPSLRTCFDRFASATRSARSSVKTLPVYTFVSAACNGLQHGGGTAMCGD
jgi:hypothetical protein